MDVVLVAIWFFFPAALANATPVVASMAFPKWNVPIDFGYKYKGKELFGPNKTWRGVISGTLAGGLIAAIQYAIWLPEILMGRSLAFMTLLGAVMGFGALFGDCIESFFKRRAGRPSGQSWFPFDQLDYIIGGVLFSLPFIQLPWYMYAWIFLLYFGIHLVTVYIFFKLGIRKQPI